MKNYQAKTEFIGRNIKYLESCESTNSLALQECLEKEIEEGFCYIANHQTNGRGQRGNGWDSKKGDNLLLSIVLKPTLNANQQFYLSKSIACGIVKGLNQWAKIHLNKSLPFSVKWPNDIYVEDKKIGGILIENQWNAGNWIHSIVGIGLNINQEHFGDLRASSLKSYSKLSEPIEKGEVFNFICTSIEYFYKKNSPENFAFIDEQYHSYLMRLNEWHLYQEVENSQVIDGKIIQVNEQGLLLMEKQNGYKLYDLKEIIFIFPS